MRALHILLLPTAAAAAFLGNVSASADTPVAITYVPNSPDEAMIANGPCTRLRAEIAMTPRASFRLPGVTTPFNPPTTADGTPYKNYCIGDRVQTAPASLRCSPTTFWG